MTTQQATISAPQDAAARRTRLAHTLVFAASAVLMFGAVQDHLVSLSIIGALFLVASTFQLFRKPNAKPNIFERHARNINIAMFAGSAALTFSAIQEHKSFAALGGGLLLMALANQLFRKAK